MTFERPLMLVILVVLPLVVWVSISGLSAVGRRQRIAATVIRTIVVAALILVLAGTALVLPERRLAVVFVVDVSDSMPAVAIERATSFVGEAIRRKPDNALAGVVAFGREARVELVLQENPELGVIATEPDGSRTDLGRALRLAAALLPEGTRRRIVILSDGKENSGDARAEAARLRGEGIRVDAVGLSGVTGPDAAVISVKAPSRVRVGDEFEIEAHIRSNDDLSALVTLRRDGEVVSGITETLENGEKRVKLFGKAETTGAITYRVDIAADRDSEPANDAGAALVIVEGPPKVIVIEGGPDEGDSLTKALNERGIVADLRGTSGFPSPQELAATESVILVDVDANSLTDNQVSHLAGFVRDAGRGLVAVGGESSWSLGGYGNTALEALLPLESEIKDPRRRPSIAQLMAIDTSGSMATCHCAGPNMSSDRLASGPNKTDISRSAAAQAIEALTENDEVGVLAFNTSSKWVIPLQRLPAREVVRNGLARLTPEGGTSIPQALRTSVEELKKSQAALKHIILFTDGWTRQEDLASVARSVREEGITLSVVATGEGPGDALARMAEEGGGRFYAGRNLEEIPEIFMNEVMLASRRYVNEGVFYPKVIGASAVTQALDATPPLLGYVGTSAKPSAAVSLAVGELDDPLLATWRAGLGMVSAWTSDAKARWSAEWLSWEGFADFWSNVVRETLPADPAPGFSTLVTAEQDGLQVRIEAEAPLQEGAIAIARIVAPDGSVETMELQRVGVGEMSGVSSSGAAGEGAYLVSVELKAGETSIYRDTVGAVRTYSPEYLPGDADSELLSQVASLTRGRVGVSPESVFDPNLPRGSKRIPIDSWLFFTALLLLPADVILRRIVITREDVADLRAWRLPWKKSSAPSGGRMAELLAAKYRLRQAGDPASIASQPKRPPHHRRQQSSRVEGSDERSATGSSAAELLRRKRGRGRTS